VTVFIIKIKNENELSITEHCHKSPFEMMLERS